jgi:hypothetical protein
MCIEIGELLRNECIIYILVHCLSFLRKWLESFPGLYYTTIHPHARREYAGKMQGFGSQQEFILNEIEMKLKHAKTVFSCMINTG